MSRQQIGGDGYAKKLKLWMNDLQCWSVGELNWWTGKDGEVVMYDRVFMLEM